MSSSSNSFASTVELRPRASLRVLRAITMLHVFCIGLLPLAMQPGPVMLGVLAGFVASWLWLRRHPALGFGPRAVTRLVWHVDGSWSLWQGSGPELKAELLAGSLVHRRLLVLRFRSDAGRRLARVLAGDEIAADPLRRLRARLSVG